MTRLLLFSLALQFALRSPAQEITLAITDCNVITMKSDKVLAHQTVLISNDRIKAIVPAGKWINREGIKTIDGRGRYVMPALADMHVHINQYSNWIFPLFLSYGVTTIRVMAGNEAVLKWRDSIRNNLKTAPDIHSAGPVIDGNPPYWAALHEGPVIQDADSVEQIITGQISSGYEFVKMYNRLNADVVNRIRSVCHQKNIKLASHTSVALHKEDIFTPQTGELQHLSGYARYASRTDTVSRAARDKYSDIAYDLELVNTVSAERMRQAARKTREYNIWNCPTLVVEGAREDSVFCRELPGSELADKLTPVINWWKGQGYKRTPDQHTIWQFKKNMVRELNKNKAALLAGTDSPAPWVVPGLAIHQELQYLAEAGLSNYEALKTATVNPALWFGKGYDKGTLENNKRADLLILSANPLTDIRNTRQIVSVIFKGRPVTPD